MTRGVVACAIAVACVSFSEIAHAQSDPSGTYWTTAPEPASSEHARVEYVPTHAPPFEPPAARFGARGQWAMLGGTSLAVSSSTFDGSDARQAQVGFSPGIDYFVVKNLAIGLAMRLAYSSTRGYGADSSLVETKSSSVLVGPRVSYNVALGRYVSWYPSVAFVAGYSHLDESLVSGSSLSIPASVAGGASTTAADAQVTLDASIYFHPRTHVLFGIGPNFSHDFARVQGGPDVGAQATSIGGGVTVGGYWGADRNGSPEDAGPPQRSLRKFGDAHEVIFTNEVLTQGDWATHAGTGSSSGYFEGRLAADYFVLPHFSVGGFVSGAYSVTTGVDAQTQLTVKSRNDSYGLGFRLGYVIPIFDAISLYPRATLSAGISDYDETSGASENSYSTAFATVGAFIPIVLEITPHFFAGFGPGIAHDLTNTTSYGYQNRETTIDASAELGVWL